MTISIADKAIRLAMRGLCVFPCKVADKRPATRNGHLDATNDPELVGLWQWGEDRLIGVASGSPSGIAVIDIDPRNGGDKWLDDHIKQLPPTRSHRTRSRGLHLLFKVTDNSVRTKSNGIAPGVDIKGDGGYVIWWPAHEGVVLDFLPLSELPGFPAGLIPERKKPMTMKTGPVLANRYRVTRLIQFTRESREGERNSRLFWAACRLAELKFQDPEQRINAVNKLLNAAVRTGLDNDEAQTTIESAFSI